MTQQRNSAAPTLQVARAIVLLLFVKVHWLYVCSAPLIVQVRCGAGAEEENVPTELCEPQPYAGDASVFDAGGGLHYTTFRSTATVCSSLNY